MPPLISQLADTLRHRPLIQRSVLAARRLRAQLVERSLNIDTISSPAASPTNGHDGSTRFDDRLGYDVMDYPLLRRFLRPLDLRADDVVFDVGCGMGRMLCMAARRGVRQCVGIEILPDLAQRARDNARTLRQPKAPIEVHGIDAAAADYSEGTVFCLFNPFGVSTLQAVLDRIHGSLRDHPRDVRIGYNHPAHADVLDDCRWLARFHTDASPWYQHGSAYWRTSNAIAS